MWKQQGRRIGFAMGVAWIGLLGCEDPARDKPKAEVAASTGTVSVPGASPATAASTRVLPFSAADSKVEFVGSKVTGKHLGSFGQFTGSVKLVDSDLSRSSVSVEIEMASVSTDAPKLTGHLKSADFFEVEKFPKARFESTVIQPGGDNGATHTVTGQLELHGAKKNVRFPAKLQLEGDKVTVRAEFSINRKDFGINYPGKVDDLIRDDVLITLTINAAVKPS